MSQALISTMMGLVLSFSVAWASLKLSSLSLGYGKAASATDQAWWINASPRGYEGVPTHSWKARGNGVRGDKRMVFVESPRHFIICQSLVIGWPLPFVSGERWTKTVWSFLRGTVDETHTVYRGAISLGPASLSNDPRQWALLPLRPVWPGFAVDALLYTAAVWLLLFAPFTVRRSIRRRRGRCSACGYPVGVSDVCTECGAAVMRG